MTPTLVTNTPGNLLVLEDLDDQSSAKARADGDLDALRTVADWIRTFVARPHRDIGRPGPVCPFVPTALERQTLWLASAKIAGRGQADIVQRINGHKRLFLDRRQSDDDLDYRSMVVVFTDLPTEEAKPFFDGLLQQLAVPAYVDDGLVLGAFYPGNEATAVHNPRFRPFAPPAPFLLIRHAVIGDWKFFLDDEAWIDRWAQRHGAAAVQALAGQLRHLPWRTPREVER